MRPERRICRWRCGKWVRCCRREPSTPAAARATTCGDCGQRVEEVLVLDEPVNGLDPEGIVWIRALLQSLAGEGRTVLVSSHLMSEMAVTAEQVIIIGKGRLIADMPVAHVILSCLGRILNRRNDIRVTGAAAQASPAARQRPDGPGR